MEPAKTHYIEFRNGGQAEKCTVEGSLSYPYAEARDRVRKRLDATISEFESKWEKVKHVTTVTFTTTDCDRSETLESFFTDIPSISSIQYYPLEAYYGPPTYVLHLEKSNVVESVKSKLRSHNTSFRIDQVNSRSLSVELPVNQEDEEHS